MAKRSIRSDSASKESQRYINAPNYCILLFGGLKPSDSTPAGVPVPTGYKGYLIPGGWVGSPISE
jgi:hypothetical protein